MTLVVPGTLSPGYLQLVYGNTTRKHRTGMRLIAGVDLDGVPALRTIAETWSDALKGLLPNDYAVYGWEILDPDRVRLFEEAWADPYVGTHPNNDGENSAANSRTIAFTGRGVGDSVFNAAGQWATRIFVLRAYFWLTGMKYLPADFDTGTQDLWSFFNECLVGPADFYGQRCAVRTQLPVQHNGFAQNHWGE